MELPEKFSLHCATATVAFNFGSAMVALYVAEPVLPWLLAMGAGAAWLIAERQLLSAKRDVDALTEILFENSVYFPPEN